MPPVIAVIEDSPAILHMLDQLLSDAGYHVISYTAGRDAHQFILRTMPDLVILDLWLEHPAAGSMVLGMLELDPITRRIPVIICSAHVHVLRGMEAQLKQKGYPVIKKPFRPVALLRTIEQQLRTAALGNDRTQ